MKQGRSGWGNLRLALLRLPLLGVLLPSVGATQDTALVELSPQAINLREGGTAARAQWIRYKLVEVNGPTGGYVLSPQHGSQAGHLGDINRLTGPEFLGSLLAQTGVERCNDIPVSGQLTGPVRGEDGEVIEATAWFGVGDRVIPDHFESAGEVFDKHIVVAEGQERILEVQLSCPTEGGLISGYFWRTPDSAEGSGKEVYFQRDDSRGLSRADVHFMSPARGEHYAFRFETLSGDSVRIWTVRAMDPDVNDSSSALWITYSPASGTAHARFFRQAGSDGVESDTYCLDLNTDSEADICEADGLSFVTPASTAPVGDRVHSLDMAGLATLQVRQGQPDLPVPGVLPDPDAGAADAPDGGSGSADATPEP